MNILFPKIQKQGVLAAKEIANVKCFHYFQKQDRYRHSKHSENDYISETSVTIKLQYRENHLPKDF